jgi:hypothetical protein
MHLEENSDAKVYIVVALLLLKIYETQWLNRKKKSGIVKENCIGDSTGVNSGHGWLTKVPIYCILHY